MTSVLAATQTHNARILAILLAGPTSSEDREKALLYASRTGLTECVRHLIQGGTDVKVRDPSGNTALYLAVNEGHQDVVNVLCEAGAEVDSRGSGNSTPLHVAARWGKDECLQILLTYGCSLNTRDSSQSTALILAVRHKQYLVIQQLIQAGISINSVDNQGRTALHYACHMAVAVETILRAGADPNVQDIQGCSPLLMACTEGLDRVIVTLCHIPGIDVNLASFHSQKTPLHILAYKGHLKCVQELILAGANTNLLDSDARAPLWYAVSNGHREVTALLLRANSQVDKHQCPLAHPASACPVRLAADKRQIEILKLFILSGYDNQHVRSCLATPEIQTLFDINQVNHWLEHAHKVMSLRAICRRWLRHHLGFHLLMDLSKLPVPEKLVDYLTFKELEEENL